jgi:hypothetical protein
MPYFVTNSNKDKRKSAVKLVLKQFLITDQLNGTAQPNLKRSLYTTDDVYTNYTIFVKNQKKL